MEQDFNKRQNKRKQNTIFTFNPPTYAIPTSIIQSPPTQVHGTHLHRASAQPLTHSLTHSPAHPHTHPSIQTCIHTGRGRRNRRQERTTEYNMVALKRAVITFTLADYKLSREQLQQHLVCTQLPPYSLLATGFSVFLGRSTAWMLGSTPP